MSIWPLGHLAKGRPRGFEMRAQRPAQTPPGCGRAEFQHAGIAQLGERQTEDLKVAGSIPAVGILFNFAKQKILVNELESYPAQGHHGTLAEWLRRLIRNQLGIARGSSNLSGVELIFNFFVFGFNTNVVSFSQPLFNHVLVAQWIAHQTSNLGVAGSNPVEHVFFLALVYFFAFYLHARFFDARANTCIASIAQLAEHALRKRKVASSILAGGWSGPLV